MNKSLQTSFNTQKYNVLIKYHFQDILLTNIYPLLQKISENLHNNCKYGYTDEDHVNIRTVYTLCADQIRKCCLSLFEIIKLEHTNDVYLQVLTFLYFFLT